MKKSLVVIAAIAMVVAMVGGVWADDNKSVTVSADVADTCIGLDPGVASAAIPLDPMNPVAVAGGGMTTVPSIKCTKGTSHVVSCTSDHSFKLTKGNDGTSDPIAYALTGGSCPGTITGNGSTAVNIPLAIDIATNDFINAESGVHSDTIKITVTY